MSILILADHDNGQLAAATLNTVTAATQIGGDIHVLVAGDASGDVAKAAAAIANTLYLSALNPQNRVIENLLMLFSYRNT